MISGSRLNAGIVKTSLGPVRARMVRAHAALDEETERARLEATDAFAELVKLNRQKQSVNRPQNVRILVENILMCQLHIILFALVGFKAREVNIYP
jgi:hypothetical protein